MICQIDINNGIPIYEQISRQVKFAVANGSLLVGEHVPSVREMATSAAVNVNTVARAYRDLQAQGVLVSIRGTGLAVASDAPEKCRHERLEMIRERLRYILRPGDWDLPQAASRRPGCLFLGMASELWSDSVVLPWRRLAGSDVGASWKNRSG